MKPIAYLKIGFLKSCFGKQDCKGSLTKRMCQRLRRTKMMFLSGNYHSKFLFNRHCLGQHSPSRIDGRFILPLETQHGADNSSINGCEKVITDGAPSPIDLDLHATLIRGRAVCKSHKCLVRTGCVWGAWCCIWKEPTISTFFICIYLPVTKAMSNIFPASNLSLKLYKNNQIKCKTFVEKSINTTD